MAVSNPFSMLAWVTNVSTSPGPNVSTTPITALGFQAIVTS